jgi:hypothetical protein
MTISEALEKAAAKARHGYEQRTTAQVSDDQIARLLLRIGERGYIPTPATVPVLRDYAAGYGIMLHGDVGHGKTFLLKCLGVRIWGADEICDYGLRHIQEWYDDTNGLQICIDDIGAEMTVCEYGARDDLLKAVITHRAERQSGITHCTTNLDSAAIIERYGDRIMSRLLGMCRPHRITSPTGLSMRRAVPHSTQVTAPAQCADIGMSAVSCQEIRNAAPDNMTTPACTETALGACQSARKGVT